MYRWELDEPAQPVFDVLPPKTQSLLTSLMDAVVLVDPLEYQRHPDEASDLPALLRTLHFGHHNEGLVAFLVYPPDDLVLVVSSGWAAEIFRTLTNGQDETYGSAVGLRDCHPPNTVEIVAVAVGPSQLEPDRHVEVVGDISGWPRG